MNLIFPNYFIGMINLSSDVTLRVIREVWEFAMCYVEFHNTY